MKFYRIDYSVCVCKEAVVVTKAMKPYKHLSGVQKRKKKVEECKKQSKMTKIDIFLRPSTSKLTSDTLKPEKNVDHTADDGVSISDLSPSTSRLTLHLKPNENIDRSANEDPSVPRYCLVPVLVVQAEILK